jgi:hypothetical protein
MFAMEEALRMCGLEREEKRAHERKDSIGEVGIVLSPSLLSLTPDFRFKHFKQFTTRDCAARRAADDAPVLTKGRFDAF